MYEAGSKELLLKICKLDKSECFISLSEYFSHHVSILDNLTCEYSEDFCQHFSQHISIEQICTSDQLAFCVILQMSTLHISVSMWALCIFLSVCECSSYFWMWPLCSCEFNAYLFLPACEHSHIFSMWAFSIFTPSFSFQLTCVYFDFVILPQLKHFACISQHSRIQNISAIIFQPALENSSSSTWAFNIFMPASAHSA